MENRHIVSIAVIIGLIVLNIFNLNKVSASLTQYGKSIAVLPFINDTKDKENDQFINGAMESILNDLAAIKDLRVVSRRSVEQYRDKIIPIPEVAEEQQVGYVLEGSMQKYGDQIRITLQLIDQNDRHLWSEQFDRQIKKAEEYFSFWSEIAHLVAEELEAVITPEEKQLMQRIPTVSLTAQNFYQKGKDIALEYYRERSLEGKSIDTTKLNMAELLFLQALEYDSTFAPAYTELAWVVWNSCWKFNSYQICRDSALTLANKALTYDDQLSEAYVVRGYWYWYSIERDEEKALAEFNKALKYNPNQWNALLFKADYYMYRDAARSFEYLHQAIWRNPEEGSTEVTLKRLIMMYMWTGFFDKAKYYSQEFLKLNRDSAQYYAYLSWIEYHNRDYNKAIEHCNKRLAIDSTDLDAVLNLGANYILLGDYEKSLKYIENYIDGINASGGDPNIFWQWIGIAYWKNGHLEMADYYLDQYFEVVNRSIERFHIPHDYIWRAQIYAFRGMKKEAVEDLTVYANKGSNHLDNLNTVKFNPLFDNIRDDPGFQQVLQRMEANYQATYEKIRKWLEENNML